MSLPSIYNPIFRDHIKQHNQPYNDAEAYGVKVVPVTDPSQPHWRVIGIHHLTDQETGGLHTVFYDLLDKQANRVPSAAVLSQKGNSAAQRVQVNKPINEPAGDVPIFKQDVVTVSADWPAETPLPSEKVTNLTTQHADEGSGATLFHHAYYVVFQQTEGVVVDEPGEPLPPVEDPLLEPDPVEGQTLVETLWSVGRPMMLPINRQTQFYDVARANSLGERLTDEYAVTYENHRYLAQIFEEGLVYAPQNQWDQTQFVRTERPGGFSFGTDDSLWSHHITGFYGTRWEYWEQNLQDKIPTLIWDDFMEEVITYNPQIANAARKILRPDQVYVMPKLPNEASASADEPATVLNPKRRTSRNRTPTRPTPQPQPQPEGLVQRDAQAQFLIKGKPSRFIGVNIRGLVHYGHIELFPGDPTALRQAQLTQAQAMNARLVRVFLPHKDSTPTQIEDRLRETITLLKESFPDIYLLPALTNLYNDVPFFVKGDAEFYEKQGAGGRDILNHAFYREGYKRNYLAFVKHIVTAFKDEPQIFAWEIGNELKAEEDPALLVTFMTEVAKAIKGWDPHHLVTTGMISTRHAFMPKNSPLRDDLYGSNDIDFITIHAYNGNENPDNLNPPPIEDDSDLASKYKKPFIIEEAGFDRNKYGNRPEKTRGDLANWFRAGASCYMPWGFVASNQDNKDGDTDVGMTRPLHPDWDNLFALLQRSGELLLSSQIIQDVSREIGRISFAAQADTADAVISQPLLTDGFDFPVGKPNSDGYYVAAGLVDPKYRQDVGYWHTGEDWNSKTGGDTDLGDPVFAVAHGEVITSHWFKTWGNVVLVEHHLPHGQTVWSQYAHLQQRYVQKGDIIQRGHPIGTIGKGDQDQFVAHLHFEIRLKRLAASNGGYQTDEDRQALLEAYADPRNFIKAYRPGTR